MNATMRLGLSSVLLLLAGGLAAYAPAALAQVAPLKNTGTGDCLTVNTTTGVAITQACNTSSIQIWSQANTGSGFLIKNVVTGNCLNNTVTGTIITTPCNPAIANQRWLRQNVGPTTARYKSVATGLFLTSTTGGAVLSSPASTSPLQIWSY
jgi:hypothetical protein